MRRKFISSAEQRIYDGFVDHHREVSEDHLFAPHGDGKGFSPYSYVVDKVFRDTLQSGPLDETALEKLFHPNPLFKRPAYYAAVDLLDGSVERGTTQFIDNWLAGGHQMLPGHSVSRHTITAIHTHSRTIAYFYDGVLYYEWGALAGHRFPSTAVAMQGKEWERLVEALTAVRKFEKGSFLHRREQFARFEDKVRMEMPKTSRLYRVYQAQGAIGLLRLFFGKRWSAVITTPDLKLAKGISHSYVKGCGNAQFLLCSMDDAIHHKLLNSSNCEVHDLTSVIDLGDAK